LKKIPPIKKLSDIFFGFKKLESKSKAVADVVSFTTETPDPCTAVNFD
jgi:hypothetical protein